MQHTQKASTPGETLGARCGGLQAAWGRGVAAVSGEGVKIGASTPEENPAPSQHSQRVNTCLEEKVGCGCLQFLFFFAEKRVEVTLYEHLQVSGMVPLLYHGDPVRGCLLIPHQQHWRETGDGPGESLVLCKSLIPGYALQPKPVCWEYGTWGLWVRGVEV